MDYIAYDTIDKDGAANHCGILEINEMPDAILTESGTYLVYNPGTEVCDTVIRIAGTAPNGVLIENNNGDICKLVSLPSSGYLEISSDHGTVKAMPADELAFEYHDEGYIRLSPCTPYDRDVMVSYESGSNAVILHAHKADISMIGKYMRIRGEWLKISSVLSDSSVVVSKQLLTSGTEQTMIAKMNELTISADAASLTRLELEYVPLLR